MILNHFKPRSIDSQTLVITDCSQGLGLATARLAAKKGARVVMVGGDSEELERQVDAINASGGHALRVLANISDPLDLMKIKDKALESFGRIDTWINNSHTVIKRSLSESDLEEERRLFEVNFWNARSASRVAVKAMAPEGGVLINIGSDIASTGMPLLGIYQASKQALKAFTDCLRNELRSRKVPVEVCLIRPGGRESVEDIAEAILRCAERPVRDLYVGGPARLSAVLETFFPVVNDLMAEARTTEHRKGKIQRNNVLRRIINATQTRKHS